MSNKRPAPKKKESKKPQKNAKTLDGTQEPPKAQPQWLNTFAYLVRHEPGELAKWGYGMKNAFIMNGDNRSSWSMPPGFVEQSFLHGIGRSLYQEPDGPGNKFQINLKYGVLPESVIQQNPALAEEHEVFIAKMREFETHFKTVMWKDPKYGAPQKESAMKLATESHVKRCPGYPDHQTPLPRKRVVELVQKALDLDLADAKELVENSGLCEGFEEDEHDEDARQKVHGIIIEESTAAFEEGIKNDAFAGWEVQTPFEFGEGTLLIKLRGKAMFARPENDEELNAPMLESPDPALQQYYTLAGPGSKHKLRPVKYFLPSVNNGPMTPLCVEKLQADPLYEVVRTGDLVSLDFGCRITTHDKKGVAIMLEPNFNQVVVHHRGKPEETRELLPSSAPVVPSYHLNVDANDF